MYLTQYVLNVVTTEAKSLSKKKLLFNQLFF